MEYVTITTFTQHLVLSQPYLENQSLVLYLLANHFHLSLTRTCLFFKAECHKLCSRLAIISNGHENNEVTKFLTHLKQLVGINEGLCCRNKKTNYIFVYLSPTFIEHIPEHLSSPPIFSGVRVTRSLVLCVCFVDRCLSFCTFSFGHCDVCSSSTYGFWLPLWYLQTPLSNTCLTGCWRDAMKNNLVFYIQTRKSFLHCQIKLIIKYVNLRKLFLIW